MSKKSLTEADIRTKFITPNIISAGWNIDTQVREEVHFTDGRIYVRGRIHTRGERKRADYILYYKPNIPIAIIEAKDNNQSVSSGIQQALGYAVTLDIPFVFSSNGDGFYFHDRTAKTGNIETEIPLDAFPSPQELWQKYRAYKGLADEVEPIVAQEYFFDGTGRAPRYYQQTAINRTVETIAKNEGGNRHLLVMATGTGKTYTAFQIIYRLWKSGLKKRILFLADRTALIDQTVRGDFRHFKEAMTVIKHKEIDPSYNIYLALYQGLSDNNSNDAYRQFSPDFFDLVIVDECHRGSAREDGKWREILEYFNAATHIGLTATPKETKEISSSEYFGEGKRELDSFINPSELYPVIATTSKLMTTGVDAQTCKLIVLDSNIGSMTEFKQIIGRGTRINEDFGKHYFTIMDFRNVTALFADKDFDGDPVRVKEAGEDDDLSGVEDEGEDATVIDDLTGEEVDFPEPEKPDVTIPEGDPSDGRRQKVTVRGVEVTIVKERVQYLGGDGKIITESLRDYTRENIRRSYASLDSFLTSWKQADKKRAIIDELEQQGVIFAALNEEVGSAFDPFDLICHVAYEQKPLTRRERAEQVKKRDYFTKYGDLARKVVAALLDKYADEGLLDLENPEIITLDPLNKLGSSVEIIRAFGGKPAYDAAIHELTQQLYRAA